MLTTSAQTGYALVDGLKMYYEIHGTGHPLVMLPGGFMTIEALGPLLPALAEMCQVIAVELEGHGRTADMERPLSYEQMAQDVAGLLTQLRIEQADILGYSMGGTVALRLASQFPDLVRKLVIVSASYTSADFYPAVVAQWSGNVTPDPGWLTAGTAYARHAPNPAHWSGFVEKMKYLLMDFKGCSWTQVQAIKAPTLLLFGDSDFIQPKAALGVTYRRREDVVHPQSVW